MFFYCFKIFFTWCATRIGCIYNIRTKLTSCESQYNFSSRSSSLLLVDMLENARGGPSSGET